LDGSQLSKVHRSGYMAVLFISMDRMPFLVPTFDDADPLFALGITQGFCLHHRDVAGQDPARVVYKHTATS